MHTGSPMREVLDYYRTKIDASTILDQLHLRPNAYFLVSAHREENVDEPDRLRRLLNCLCAVRDTWGLPVLVSTHPRTRKRLEALTRDPALTDGISFHEPFGLFDYVHLQMNAKCTLSDSGTISEESAILAFPAVTIRDSMERLEALETGSMIMTGLDEAAVIEAVSVVITRVGEPVACPVDYGVADTSSRVVSYILSTVRRHHEWAGVRVSATTYSAAAR
jgi:UDP-N-acetylglucosamine 2-epimerase (non-hydrolysing)